MNVPTTPVSDEEWLSAHDHDRIEEVVATVADRMADPDQVAAIAGRDDNRDPIYDNVMWSPVTLSNGWPGVATFLAEIATGRTDENSWRTRAHAHLVRAAASLDGVPHRGMYAGPAAVLAAAQTAAGPAGHYAGMRTKLADWLAQIVLARLDHEQERVNNGMGIDWFSYDLINGLSGSARLLLDSARDPTESGPRVQQALDGVLRHLVRLAEPVTAHHCHVPGWWVPPEGQPTERDRADYPEGDFNLGLAHGIAGPLTVLAHALRAGFEVDGHREAIAAMVDWLLGWRLWDDAGVYWPCRVSFTEETAVPRMTTSGFTRTAWCYGAPGVAVALHAAGKALNNPQWTAEAAGVFRAAFVRNESEWAIDGATICHGYAGLLTICGRLARDTADPELWSGTVRLVRSVLDHADESAPFVFPHLMRFPRADQTPGRVHRAVDVAGLLEGAAGVAAALATTAHPPDREGGIGAWDRCLGLS